MATGIIAEFNPFHNGHKYLLEQTADESGVIVIMSGSFVQRGGIAVTDKWTRAKAALQNGADLVLELPVIYAMNTAQKFAYGAVRTLFATGIATAIAFGSESGDSARLIETAKLLCHEPPEVSARLKQYINTGMSYPAARARAYEGYADSALLSSPNDILALEYIRAGLESGAQLGYRAVKRLGAEHDSSTAADTVASASLLREIKSKGGDISAFTPMGDFPLYDSHALDTAIIARLRTCGAEYLRTVADVTEGLENRFISAAMRTDDLKTLCEAVKSKRYPLSRIRRIAYAALLGITKAHSRLKPSYIRVLGMNRRGQSLLKEMKTAAVLPVITKAADYAGDEIFSINNRAEDLFALCAPHPSLRHGGTDITHSPVIIA